ncbi:divergent polysaccharide deacetylase family protein [Shewanella maritima]|uniref:divergent polysaccharide deacetylase family protein n=1 Tax=Shewanella maritima TaxID=2520507 RepID=UPI003735C6DA
MRSLLLIIISLITAFNAHGANIAIIIDDIGYRQSDKAVLTLPQDVTLSVLPHTPLGQRLAKKGHQGGFEIMLHMPMQTLDGRDLGPGGMTNQMSEQQIKQVINSAVEHIPYAKGLNNHMGSLLTQLREPMSWVMESIKEKDMYFVDSVTTRYSKAGEQALLAGVPILQRHIFLDNQKDIIALQAQFDKAIEQAKEDGMVILIGHPYPETVMFLNNNIDQLASNGVKLVPTSQLLPIQTLNAVATTQQTSVE